VWEGVERKASAVIRRVRFGYAPASAGKEKGHRTMKHVATITKLQDIDQLDEATAIVRCDASGVALCLTIRSDGDVDVFMTRDVVRELVEALQQAIADS